MPAQNISANAGSLIHHHFFWHILFLVFNQETDLPQSILFRTRQALNQNEILKYEVLRYEDKVFKSWHVYPASVTPLPVEESQLLHLAFSSVRIENQLVIPLPVRRLMFSTVTSEEYYEWLHVPHQVFISPSSAVSGEYGWVPSKVGSHSSSPAGPSSFPCL